MDYLDLEIRFETSSDRSEPRLFLDSPAGQARGPLRIPIAEVEAVLPEIARGVRGSARRIPDQTSDTRATIPLEPVGAGLCQALFAGKGEELLRASQALITARRDTGLRIKLRLALDEPEQVRLANLPWELLYDEKRRQFLARSLSIVRFVELSQPWPPLAVEPPLRILIAASNPTGSLDLATEAEALRRACAKNPRIQTTFLDKPTLIRLREEVRSCHVLHFMGHGGFDGQGNGCLRFPEDLVTAQQIADCIGGLDVRLVVLNACDTGRDVLAPFTGVARALVGRGLGAVVAMQFPISDSAAIAFSDGFYRCLARGGSIDEAVGVGRLAVSGADPGTLEWSTPVLYMRAPDGRIFEVKQSRSGLARRVAGTLGRVLPKARNPGWPERLAGAGSLASILLGSLCLGAQGLAWVCLLLASLVIARPLLFEETWSLRLLSACLASVGPAAWLGVRCDRAWPDDAKPPRWALRALAFLAAVVLLFGVR